MSLEEYTLEVMGLEPSVMMGLEECTLVVMGLEVLVMNLEG